MRMNNRTLARPDQDLSICLMEREKIHSVARWAARSRTKWLGGAGPWGRKKLRTDWYQYRVDCASSATLFLKNWTIEEGREVRKPRKDKRKKGFNKEFIALSLVDLSMNRNILRLTALLRFFTAVFTICNHEETQSSTICDYCLGCGSG